MGLTSCRWITIAGRSHTGDTMRNRDHAGCRVAVDRTDGPDRRRDLNRDTARYGLAGVRSGEV
jgi:hypothetical protein